MSKWLGKIIRAEFGFGGYQDAMIGLSITISGDFGTADFWGMWSAGPSSSAEWTEQDQKLRLGEAVLKVRDLLKSAGVDSVSKLAGVPVEVTSEGNRTQSWRVLTEVL